MQFSGCPRGQPPPHLPDLSKSRYRCTLYPDTTQTKRTGNRTERPWRIPQHTSKEIRQQTRVRHSHPPTRNISFTLHSPGSLTVRQVPEAVRNNQNHQFRNRCHSTHIHNSDNYVNTSLPFRGRVGEGLHWNLNEPNFLSLPCKTLLQLYVSTHQQAIFKHNSRQ